MSRVFYSWTKKEYIRSHVPQEFKSTAELLTCKQLEEFSKQIDNYYQRLRRQIEGGKA